MNELVTAIFGAITGGFIVLIFWLVLERWLKKPVYKFTLVAVGALAGSLILQLINSIDGADGPQKFPEIASNTANESETLSRSAQSDDEYSQKPTLNGSDDVNDDVVEPQITLSLGLALLNDLAKKDPVFSQRLETEFLSGDPSAEAIDEYAFTIGIGEALKYIPRARDESLVELVEGMAYITNQLVTTDPRICYAWYYGAFEYETFDFQRYRNSIGDALLALQFKLYSNIVLTALDEYPLFDQDLADEAVSRASFAMLQFAGFENSGLITGEAGPRNRDNNDEYVVACQARFVLYQSLLSEDIKADAIRQFFSRGT